MVVGGGGEGGNIYDYIIARAYMERGHVPHSTAN